MQRIAAMAMMAALLLIGWAFAQAPSKSTIPDDIAVSGPEIARTRATGDQIYTWQAESKTWKLKAPEATFGGGGVQGKHYAGPTWEEDDGSKVVGRKLVEHASPDADAIPWLLLEATSHDGAGVFDKVTFIQRIKTVGGNVPSTPGSSDGEEVRVHYAATYVFYGAGATTHPVGK
jgi:Protein of unknown function (DUF3455)